MKQFHNTITLRAVFGNMARDRHVLFVIKDEAGKYLLGAKPDFYPEGIYRFSGGGVDSSETPTQAAIREAAEELSLNITSQNLTPLAEITTEAVFQGKTIQNVTTLFLLQIADVTAIQAGDDIAYLQPMTREELQALVERYRSLPDEKFVDDGYEQYWRDYGEMYAFIHQVALDLTV
jgi:8-oxo-dGTP pyrophosphatase MutT (NUDIX family)